MIKRVRRSWFLLLLLTLEPSFAVLVPEINGTITTSSGECTLDGVKLNIIDTKDLCRFGAGTMAFEREI